MLVLLIADAVLNVSSDYIFPFLPFLNLRSNSNVDQAALVLYCLEMLSSPGIWIHSEK